MPSPKKGEKRKDFLSRCMGDTEARKDFPENAQRYAFCVSQWDRRKKKNVSIDIDIVNEAVVADLSEANKRSELIKNAIGFEHAVNDLIRNYGYTREEAIEFAFPNKTNYLQVQYEDPSQISSTTMRFTEPVNGTTTTIDNGSLTVSSESGDTLRSGLSFRLNAALVREVEENGRNYLVTPVVAIREGVLNGEFVPAQEIALSTDQWNGVPITIGHPKVDGDPVSLVQHPEASSNSIVGEFRKSSFDGKALHGEIWVDVELAEKQGEEGEYVLNQLRSEQPMDVSTGYVAMVKHQSGTFGEDVYAGVQQGIIPDHLALLPFENGACSWEDGCGTPRVNSEKQELSQEKSQNRKEESIIGNKALDALKMLGHALGFNVQVDDQNEIVQNVSDCCRCGNDHSDLKFNKFSHSEEGCPFDIWATCPDTEEPILSVHQLKVNGANLGTLLTQMITDQITGDRPRRTIIKDMADKAGTGTDKVKSIIAGDVEFLPNRWLTGFAQALDVSVWDIMMAMDRDIQSFMKKNLPTSETDTEQPIAMQAEESEQEDVEEDTGNEADSAETTLNTEEVETMPETRELADAVLANESLSFTDDDREWLESLSEEKLQAMIAKEPEPQVEEPVVEEPEEEEVVATPPRTIADLMATIENNSLKASMKDMIRTNDEICTDLISQITENSDFTKDELSGKSVSELKKLAALATKQQEVPAPSYLGAGVPRQQSEEVGVPEPPKILTAPVETKVN